jgi:TolB-like protein
MLLGLVSGCATTSQGNTKILDVAQEDDLGGTGTSSADVRNVAEKIARGIVGIEWPHGGAKPRIAVLPIRNETRFRVDPKLLQNKLVKELVNFSAGKIAFLARDSEQAVMLERGKKRAGIYDSGKKTASLAGADYLLKGEMRALSKASREGVSDYIVYSFELIDAEDSSILWAGEFETKKQGQVGIIYQ